MPLSVSVCNRWVCLCAAWWIQTSNALQRTTVWPYLKGPHAPGTCFPWCCSHFMLVQLYPKPLMWYSWHLHDTIQFGENEKSKSCAKSVSFYSHHMCLLSINQIHFVFYPTNVTTPPPPVLFPFKGTSHLKLWKMTRKFCYKGSSFCLP